MYKVDSLSLNDVRGYSMSAHMRGLSDYNGEPVQQAGSGERESDVLQIIVRGYMIAESRTCGRKADSD